ncbi:hypothetical protein TGGT1_410880 [Toxoplasma gondii GT1]|uniref:Uncharacterized protein n=4 Tax=Toxoplasma gondii TaxID=5811 RepID=B9Q2R0_TOXGV|nr:hypothetical protein TGGT1_410880 [Toxoplasma gondii GT1]ESS28443.1 hypothetical protein TGVEG_300370 [Toxoplasma gondii VEG]KAF4638092.1 hypothetical protein TGRH88_057010 [Toxoplasma gondii]RQX66556.1 hypothetical protein TGCAST_292600 [Toxoplasma gondii CAST]CEL77991.1 TPA: hypothetical protein BN1205_007400 [Toxoplasma gondii VEG]
MPRLYSFVVACWLAQSSRSVAHPVDDIEPEAEPPAVVYETSDPHDTATGSIEAILKQQVQDNVAASNPDFSLSSGGTTPYTGNAAAAADEALKQILTANEQKKARVAEERGHIDEERSRHSRRMMELEDKLRQSLDRLQERENNIYASEHKLESQLEKGEKEMKNLDHRAAEGRFLHKRIHKSIIEGEEGKLKSKYHGRIHPHRHEFAK